MPQRIFILLPILTLFFHSSSGFVAINSYYQTCSRPSRCSGTNINVSFPFSLLDSGSPSYCGIPGYELHCSVVTSELSLKFDEVDYRVKDINYTQGFITLVDSDFLGNSCPHTFTNTSINFTLFDFADLDFNLTVFINCSFPLPGLVEILCSNGLFGLSYYMLEKGPPALMMSFFGVCQMEATVPVYSTAAMSLNSSSAKFGEALQQGFRLKWSAGKEWCKGCLDSGGVCGYNSTMATDPTCFCPNNTALGTCPYERKESSNSKTGLIIGLTIAGVFSFILFCSLCFLIYRRWKKKQSSSSNFLDRSTCFAMSSKTDPELGSSLCTPIFSYDELYEATDAFDASKELGDGGFGTVYKGKLKDGRVVAVKRLHESNYRRAEQFLNEVKIVSLLRHQNLVSLYGCTSRHSRELLLVFEYVPNGTVADHLHGFRASDSFLPWKVRISIAIETADALNYLHSVEPSIIHRDVKTNNILLDNNFHVKVADFGLSRLFPLDATHVSTAPQGTPGYVDPEYHRFFQLTDKSDVYSFGVVLLELISSLPAVDINRELNEANLAYMAIKKIERQELHEFVDPRLGYDSDSSINAMITQAAGLALQCLQSEREMRPSIKEVLEILRGIEKNGCMTEGYMEEDDAVKVKEEACLLKSKPPYSPNSVADRWVSNSSSKSSFSG